MYCMTFPLKFLFTKDNIERATTDKRNNSTQVQRGKPTSLTGVTHRSTGNLHAITPPTQVPPLPTALFSFVLVSLFF